MTFASVGPGGRDFTVLASTVFGTAVLVGALVLLLDTCVTGLADVPVLGDFAGAFAEGAGFGLAVSLLRAVTALAALACGAGAALRAAGRTGFLAALPADLTARAGTARRPDAVCPPCGFELDTCFPIF